MFRDLLTTEKYSVVVRKENFVVFTQTDKKIYSPGQTVKYRVIVMRTDFSLYDGFCDVTLISAEGIQINKKENAALVKGFSQGEFELVDSATHGQWKIKVALDGYRQTYVTVFDIEEYHLPKFDITFDMPDVVRADSASE
ncbi:Oidioi.mRNA.OKI2018_I69.XSR.g16283.t1.cds [Oikopleura dioica]|uniref:Oidioi.mRNA.OKI2018_I69.XSR.g16283.t1.cds n=1 Tax=Oikopleura dioica TaxID=34765 RepID=A0ABN7SG42_OIKDI|nr:Oidioi.mRNA.OKI2018_I69.XSR.g16283.t1.cds [Oikopleura dioica]